MVGALTEAIKTVCSDNGCMNVFRGGLLELDGVICRFVCLVFFFLFFLMFPYCVIMFYSWTYFEEDVVVCGDSVQW